MSLSGAITGWNSQWIKRIECPRGKIYCREKLPLAFDPNFAAAFSFVCQVESSYTGLMQGAEPGTGAVREPQLGGNLLYAGELDEAGRALVVAGNIAGAASLAATANLVAQKQAVRDGVVDFLVTSLDEALRILKNEIRKRETVAVCVGVDPVTVEREMLERGVLPDLLGSCACQAEGTVFLNQGARRVESLGTDDSGVLVDWRVTAAPARWLPKLDAIALDCLQLVPGSATGADRRWLRLAPRYLGRMAQGMRLLRCDDQIAARFLEQVREQVESGEIPVAVEIQTSGRGQSHQHRFLPPGNSESAG